jgi:uncharacterized protein YndB with AHSA1/START domain
MRLETWVVINRPINEVWAFLSDPFNVPRWRGSRLAVQVTSPGPVGVGSTLQHRIAVFGLETRLTHTVTEWDAPHTLAWAVRFPGVDSASERYSLEATADGTKVTRVYEGEPRGMLKLLSPIVGALIRRQADAQNQKLKRLLEASRG